MAILADRRKRMILYTFIAFLLILGLFYKYYNIYEEIRVSQFFRMIIAGDYQAAYKLWQPTASYKYSDFLEDWGDNGYYAGGRITSFRLESSHSKGGIVLMRVRLNGTTEVRLIINRDDKHFSFAP